MQTRIGLHVNNSKRM